MLPRDVPYGGFMGRGGGGGGPYGGEGPVMSQQMRPPMVPGSMMGGMPGGMPMHGMMGPQQGMFMMGQPRAQSFMGGPAGPVTGRPSMPPGMQSGMNGKPSFDPAQCNTMLKADPDECCASDKVDAVCSAAAEEVSSGSTVTCWGCRCVTCAYMQVCLDPLCSRRQASRCSSCSKNKSRSR